MNRARRDRSAQQDHAAAERRPYRVRLPGFIDDGGQEVGLGDVIKRATYAVGIAPCGGCARRAAALNRWLVFTGGATKSHP